jgi:hypothetical protein
MGKSNPYIVMVSTPNQPNGLLEQIELEPAERCLYKRLYLDYTYGLGKIYSEEEITNAMASPSFQREYCLKYGGHCGNTFSESSIQSALFKGERIPLTTPTGNLHSRKVCAVDPGFGSSACGICVCQLIDYRVDPKTNAVTSYSDNGSYTGNVVQVLYAEEFERANFEAMIAVTVNLMKKYGIYSDPEGKVYVDGSASAFVRSLKIAIGEDPNYESAIARAKTSGLKHPWWLGKVESVMFGTGGAHKAMLGHAKMMMDKGFVAIHPSFTKLIIAIHTAYENEGSLDKERSSHTDVFDAFRMALKFFELASGGSSSSYLGR